MLGRMSRGGRPPTNSNAARAALLQQAGPLPHRHELEQRLGQDLAGVQAVTGLGSDMEALQADAMAIGSDLLLFADVSPSLEQAAHEVAHVVQQGPGSGRGTSRPGDSAEREAAQAGRQVAAGQDVQISQVATGEVQGDWLTGAVVGGLLGGLPGAVIGGLIGDAMADSTPEEEIEEFRATTFAPLLDHHPSSGGMFDVYFDASTLAMRVELKVSFDFIAGDPSQVPAGFRPEEFQWTDDEKQDWRTRYMADVVSTWSQQYRFSSTQEGWDQISVGCAVEVRQSDADPHFVLHVEKYPTDADMVQSSVCTPGTNHDPTPGSNLCLPNPPDASGTVPNYGNVALDSNDMRDEAKLDWGAGSLAVHFSKGSTALNAAAKAELSPAKDQLVATATTNATLTGHASLDHPQGVDATEGAIHNMDLARERNDAVKAELTGAGVGADRLFQRNKGEQNATVDQDWCRVDVRVGTHQTQDPAVHETGHMLGLGDEYGAAGTDVAASYKTLLADQAGVEIKRGRTDSIMSNGSTVERWHYSTFLEALKEITSMETWSL
ncbi:MAG: DUF4157 domain-containing protein [Oligoflexia bacterium]|nr:DUF4157 domain-containing protein [Oligoflexia bacterium]